MAWGITTSFSQFYIEVKDGETRRSMAPCPKPLYLLGLAYLHEMADAKSYCLS